VLRIWLTTTTRDVRDEILFLLIERIMTGPREYRMTNVSTIDRLLTWRRGISIIEAEVLLNVMYTNILRNLVAATPFLGSSCVSFWTYKRKFLQCLCDEHLGTFDGGYGSKSGQLRRSKQMAILAYHIRRHSLLSHS